MEMGFNFWQERKERYKVQGTRHKKGTRGEVIRKAQEEKTQEGAQDEKIQGWHKVRLSDFSEDVRHKTGR